MKKLLILIPIMLAVLVSGCVTQDPKEIVKDSIENMEALQSYKASYDISFSMQAMYGLNFEGEMEIYKKGNKTRADTIMTMMGQSMVSSTYTLPSGIYTCTESSGTVTCAKGQQQSVMSPEESIALNTELIDKGVIILTFNNIANIIGRDCYNITSDFNTSKLGELESENLENISIVQGMLSSLEAFTEFKIIQCYDFETGMPLTMSMIFEIDTSKMQQQGMVGGKMNMLIEMTAKSYEPNAAIEDSVFELPAEPIDLAKMCTDSETGTIMTSDEAKAIALASECLVNGTLTETYTCNSGTGTWWIDLDVEMEGCSPACVVDIVNETAEINWRCTGLIDYECPDLETIDCMPIVEPELQQYCSGDYHEWITENCDVEFTY